MRAFAAVATLSLLGSVSAARAQSTAINDVRIFDGTEVFTGSVRIRGARIEEVSREPRLPADLAVNGHGKTLLPGLIDAHVHFGGKEAVLEQDLRFGVTTVIDLFGPAPVARELRAREDKPDATLLADVRTAGTLATAPGGHGTEYSIPIPTLRRAAEADGFVRTRLGEGSDLIKIVYDHSPDARPTLDLLIVRALIGAAHAHGAMAVVHIGTGPDALDVARAGADGLAHGIGFEVLPGDLIAALRANHAFVIPTLTVMTLRCGLTARDFAADPAIAKRLDADALRRLALPQYQKPIDDECLAATFRNTLTFAKESIPLLVGTDAGNANTAHGASIHHELELLVRAGLTPLAALTAATKIPAQTFRLADRGTIAKGQLADLVLVDGDPTTDIKTTRRAMRVWKRGRVVPLTPVP